jgi:hypothetical protein
MSKAFRQIHLDFHTSEAIPEVGQKFDGKEFASAFKRAHVNSVTLFARCHHGWNYYDGKVGQRHPNLNFDLLRAQYDALKAEGIRVPIYITCAWDELSCREHPEWRVITPEGNFLFAGGNLGTQERVRWGLLDFSTPYMDFLEAQIEEVATLFSDCDGIFLDIAHQYPSCSPAALQQMKQMGLDWTSEEDRLTHAAHVKAEYMRRTTAAAKVARADMPVVHNHGNLTLGDRSILDFNESLEIESLPTGGWGYEHFPIGAKYAETIGADYLGMTGKFHTTWGEFGAFKHPTALQYECGFMLAHGARCSIGDHLHPSGAITQTTYDIIGKAYKEVEEKEPWCVGTKNVAEIAVLSVRAINTPNIPTWEPASVNNIADEGASRLLLEEHQLFDFIDVEAEFSNYRLIIIPDEGKIGPELQQKLQAFVDQGGRLLLTGQSGVDAETQKPLFDFGAEIAGPAQFANAYAAYADNIAADFVNDPVLLGQTGFSLKVTNGESLGQMYDPYFDRCHKHFNGHMNTPYHTEPSEYAAGVVHNRVAYLPYPMFSIYFKAGAVVHREVLGNLVDLLLDNKRKINTSLPAGGRVTLRKQEAENRDIVHLLYATPQLRGTFNGQPVEIIQDLPELRQIDVVMKSDKPVSGGKLVPENKEVAFEQAAGEVKFTVDKIQGHQMVAISY